MEYSEIEPLIERFVSMIENDPRYDDVVNKTTKMLREDIMASSGGVSYIYAAGLIASTTVLNRIIVDLGMEAMSIISILPSRE